MDQGHFGLLPRPGRRGPGTRERLHLYATCSASCRQQNAGDNAEFILAGENLVCQPILGIRSPYLRQHQALARSTLLKAAVQLQKIGLRYRPAFSRHDALVRIILRI